LRDSHGRDAPATTLRNVLLSPALLHAKEKRESTWFQPAALRRFSDLMKNQ